MKILCMLLLIFCLQLKTSANPYKFKYEWYSKYSTEIRYYTNKYKLSQYLICAIIERESRGNCYAIGKAGERGLMQPIPEHYKGNVYNLHIPSVNLDIACKYLKRAYLKAKGDIRLTAMYYNGGLNRKAKNYKCWNYVDDIEKLFTKY